MKLLLIFLSVLSVLRLCIAGPFEVTSGEFQPPGEANPRPCKFIKVDGQLVLLPQRSSYRDVLHSSDNSIWAVNYHETSNFESVDIIVSYSERLFILPNIWSNLEDELKMKGLLPHVPFDRCRLSIISVQDDTLNCTFTGLSKQIDKELTTHFSLAVQRQADRINLEISK
jgi:hypothetical protein